MSGIAGIFGSVLGAIGAIAQGQAEARAAEYNAELMEQQARQAREAASAEAQDFKRLEHRKLAASTAARGAMGVAQAGSPLMVDDAVVREIALGASRLTYAGQVKSTRFQNEAELERIRGKNAKIASYFGAGTSLLSGFGSIYEAA